MKKSTFLPKFQFFFAQNWHFCTNFDIDRNTCNFASKFTQHYFITGLGNSLICPKTDDFWIKMLFFTKRKQRHQKLTLSKTEDVSLRKLNISIKKLTFLKMVTICYKNEKILQNWCFCKIFDFTSEAHITKKIKTSKTNWHFFQNWQLKYF